jgi:VanZ family protein
LIRVLSLRYPWVWWVLGGLLVAGVVIGSLMPAPEMPELGLSDKMLHAGAYGTLMLWFAGLYRWRRHWVIAGALALLGLVLDIAQGTTATRSFDLGDVAANAGGILLALVLARFIFEGWCQRVEQWFFA